jgi:dihydrofolate reductase
MEEVFYREITMEKQLTVIATLSQNGVYAEGDEVPWNLLGDHDHCKDLIHGHTVIMGHRTWELLPLKYRPLVSGRTIVITRTPYYFSEGADVSCSLRQAIERANDTKIFFLGGSRVWASAMAFAEDAWITVIKQDYPITYGVTKTLCDLVTPHYVWNGFRLKEIKKPITRGEDIPYYEIYHWVR